MWKLICIVTLASLISGCVPTLPVKPVARPTVVMFTAKWCIWCLKAKPTVAKLDAVVTYIDIDERPELARWYNITSVPTFIVTVHGKQTRTQDVKVVQQLLR